MRTISPNQRDDRQIVAAQLERRSAEQDAEHGGGGHGDPDTAPADVDAEVLDARNAVVSADRVDAT